MKKPNTTEPSKPTSARLLKNRPLDPEKDNEDVRPPSLLEQQGPTQIEEPKLLAKNSEAERPKAVQNGRLLATYVGLGLEKTKDDELLAHLDFSFVLEKIHNGFIPDKVKRAWEYLAESGDKLVQVRGIPAVTLDVYLTPKESIAGLHLVGAEVVKAVVSIVEEVGKGKAKEVTRFAFRVLVERTEDVIQWAAWNDGKEFWITVPPTQKSLLPKGKKK